MLWDGTGWEVVGAGHRLPRRLLGRTPPLDLVLPFVFRLGTPIHLEGLGHGGLIETLGGRRFPAYENP